MTSETMKKTRNGFSLIELLVVVAILAVLAAVVVPQFSDSSNEAQESALRSNLAALRSAVEMFYRDHGFYPASVGASGLACTSGLTGTGAFNTTVAFTEQLTRYTNAAGESCTVNTDAGFVYGPYLKNGVPGDPVNNNTSLTLQNTGDLSMDGTGGTGGWKFDHASGKLIVNDPNYDQW